MGIITEGKTKIKVEVKKIVDKKMPVFYNPIMDMNRDFSLLAISAINKKNLKILDPLAGSGIRSLRILNELNPNLIDRVVMNDIKEDFENTVKENLELNNIPLNSKVIIKNEDANKTMNSQGHFDYIEIDPFGTPNPFLDSAIRSLNRDAILSVTATDTSSLCGSYPKACERKYWSTPLRNELMHEFAARILIRKVQLLGTSHEKALIPLVTYANDHYLKIFFKAHNNKSDADSILKKHEYYKDKGPIWIGDIQNTQFIDKMIEHAKNIAISPKTIKLLDKLKAESEINTMFFYDIHEVASENKTKSIPKAKKIIESLEKKGFKATKTHFNKNAIKTDAKYNEIVNVFNELIN